VGLGGQTGRLTMRGKVMSSVWCAAFVLAVSAGAVAADPGCSCEDGQQRADRSHNRSANEGQIGRVSCLAVPADTGHYFGYSVGGGVPCLGGPPCPEDGTWGWDYSGWLLSRRVMLRWTHGRRYQGGVGAYRTTGVSCESKSTP
jgi:hypothetical protein